MSSTTGKRSGAPMRSAAWRISLWAALAFACGSTVIFLLLQQFMAGDIQRRSDAWLAGEVEVLGDVAQRTPKDALYGRVVGEVAELAEHEVPNHFPRSKSAPDAVFFLQTGNDGSARIWVGAGDGASTLQAIRQTAIPLDQPTDLRVPGFAIPYRVAGIQLADGSHIYLGLSERDEIRVLRKLRLRFLLLWLAMVLLGAGIVFFVTRRVLRHVRDITEAASQIGQSDLNTRVPMSNRNDEIAQLALTLNGMLDRIESSVRQLHTITDSLAHDLRSPLTAIRGKLEMSLATAADEEQAEPIVSSIEELDRLTEFLNNSFDVAEARADALRITRGEVDLTEMLRVMVDLYEPSMSEHGLTVSLRATDGVMVFADAALLHRMIANLLDNELKHLPAGRELSIELACGDDSAQLIVEDNGPGFEANVLAHLFEQRVKGRNSAGHGMGLAFVDAVVRAHGGSVTAANCEDGGARIAITLPLAPVGLQESRSSAVAGVGKA
jgi:signal transduction histidine kinase